MSGLPEELRREVEKIVKKELDAAGALSSLPNGLLTAQDARYSADRIARRAAELAVEFERKRLMELVCSECGLAPGETDHGWCNVGGNYCGDFVKFTRAEFLRRKEGR